MGSRAREAKRSVVLVLRSVCRRVDRCRCDISSEGRSAIRVAMRDFYLVRCFVHDRTLPEVLDVFVLPAYGQSWMDRLCAGSMGRLSFAYHRGRYVVDHDEPLVHESAAHSSDALVCHRRDVYVVGQSVQGALHFP